jgi:uncharacterized repeat protein (TIGR01451 family)
LPKRIAILFLLLVCGLLSGCGSGALISDIEVSPQIISPNADGVDDVAAISYRISDNCDFSLILVDSDGNRHFARKDLARVPTKSNYTALFGGAIDGKLLPDGDYTMILEASDARGRTTREETWLKLEGGDKLPIEIKNLTVAPNVFTPNRDGIKDRITIGYYLTKEAAYVEVYLTDGAGNRYPIPDDQIRDVGAPGNHEHDYDAGVDAGATPPPDGVYTVWVVVEDLVGNRDSAKATLTIEMGGVPQAEIVKRGGQWSSTVVPLGETLTFTCTVKNIGRVPIRTKGPEPGSLYDTSLNFNSLTVAQNLPRGDDYYEEPGIFRVGVDFEDNTSGRPYPFRWQICSSDELTLIDGELYMMPDQACTVSGSIKIKDPPVKIAPYFWIGLLHEQVQWMEEYVERTQISIGY